jgi:hypothetical protein
MINQNNVPMVSEPAHYRFPHVCLGIVFGLIVGTCLTQLLQKEFPQYTTIGGLKEMFCTEKKYKNVRFRMRINGEPTAVSCTMGANEMKCIDAVHSITVDPTDVMGLEVERW